MPFAANPIVPGSQIIRRRPLEVFRLWNRRLHYYAGLFLLFFVWLFAFTGLLLNHPKWTFAEFWENRKVTTFEREVNAPRPGGDLAQARDIQRQLGIAGEIEWTTTRNNGNQFDFRVSRPGRIFEIKTDLIRQRASVQRTDLNLWGVVRILHTFTGMRMDDPRNQRDWVLTSVWAWAMDAVAAGLIFLVLSGLFMWCELRQKFLLGVIVLTLGLLSCGLFCVGLRWLY
jgi:hypothetical protein